MLNLLKNGEVIRQVVPGAAVNHDGIYTSPAKAGWNHGEYELAEAPPAPEPEPLTPEEIRAQMLPLTPRQFRDALIDHDIMPEAVTGAITQIEDEKERAKAMNAWEYTTSFIRTDPLIDLIGDAFGLSPEDIDEMWNAGA